jgi:phosphoribosylformylglycinamidine cyclo-ligase/phosphoribosylamine--glycine ligase/phosphoribosylformylglycinamidine cyclo-ligase
MPGVYGPGEFDVAGTIVGVMERERILPRGDLQPGDLLVGLESSGPHTNGYSLIRQVFKDIPLDCVYPQLHGSLADALLAPHRSYLPILAPVLDLVHTPIKALAHLTGGGFIENIPRVLPEGLQAVVERNRWIVPPLFELIQQKGNIDPDEMYRVFNMGIGMVAVVGSKDLEVLMANLPVDARVIGYLQQGERKVILR